MIQIQKRPFVASTKNKRTNGGDLLCFSITSLLIPEAHTLQWPRTRVAIASFHTRTVGAQMRKKRFPSMTIAQLSKLVAMRCFICLRISTQLCHHNHRHQYHLQYRYSMELSHISPLLRQQRLLSPQEPLPLSRQRNPPLRRHYKCLKTPRPRTRFTESSLPSNA